jgi:cytochrome c peroxidase
MRARLAFAAALGVAACGEGDEPAPPWVWSLPPGFPEPFVPADNPMSAEKVALGERLFFDARLSWNESLSCAGCHDPELAFSDARAKPVGSADETLPRSSMSLLGAAWVAPYTWANPVLETLEEQALVPLFADAPLEIGLQRDTAAILGRFAADPAMAEAFAAAFPDDDDPIQTEAVVAALASYQRTLVGGDSAYDRLAYGGDAEAMSDAALRGMDLFFSERTECYHCHGGFLFTVGFRSAAQPGLANAFFNNGLYDVGGTGDYPAGNQGLFEFTANPADRGKFRPPSLRNVAVTAPYMHDGSIATLEDVVAHYMAGGRNVEDGPLAGDGRAHPNKDPLVAPRDLSAEERADLVEFLRALTDARYQGG